MGKTSVFFIVLCVSIAWSSVKAQVVDMRAFSRQRGYKAYQGKPPVSFSVVSPSVPQRRENENIGERNPPASGETSEAAGNQNVPSDDQTEEFLKYIEENPHVKPDI